MNAQEQRLREFAQRQRTARPVRRGGIDPRCRLPDLSALLKIDAKAELAARQAREGSDEPSDSDIRQGGE